MKLFLTILTMAVLSASVMAQQNPERIVYNTSNSILPHNRVYSIVGYSTPTVKSAIKSDTVKLYYRHLNHNHMSPYFDYEGRYSITAEEADTVNHYCFVYYNDTLRSITEVGSDYSFLVHPLLLIGTERIDYSYSPGKIIRKYLNSKGEPYPNYKGIYIEEVTIDNYGQKKSLKYFDYKGQPMQGIWNISEYNWELIDTLIVEKRKNLTGNLVDVSPYFPFHISALRVNSAKHTITHYNIDNNNHVIDNSYGVASYVDTKNLNGDMITWAYFNSNSIPISSYAGYSVAEHVYNTDGSYKQINFYTNSQLVGCYSFTYDKAGNVNSYRAVWDNVQQPVSNNTNIGFTVQSQTQQPVINTTNHTIDVYLPKGIDLSYIVPTIAKANGAFVQPSSGIPVDFSKGYYTYTIVAENTAFKQDWKVILHEVDVNGIETESRLVPRALALAQNYPNPFNPTTTISFGLPSKSFVSLKVFDLLGKEVATIVTEELSAGSYSRTWNAQGLPSGVYFYRLHARSFTETKRLVFLK